MNKKWIASLACVCLLASSFTAAVAEGMKPGTYTEVARGMYDGLTVDVTVSESKIEDIKVTAYNRRNSGSAVSGGRYRQRRDPHLRGHPQGC